MIKAFDTQEKDQLYSKYFQQMATHHRARKRAVVLPGTTTFLHPGKKMVYAHKIANQLSVNNFYRLQDPN